MVGRKGNRILVLGAAAVVGLSACSGSTTVTTTFTAAPTTASTESPTTTAPPPPATTTTAEVLSTTTTVDPLARPEKLVSNFDRESIDDFDTTGDDLYRVVLELKDLFNFLEGHPTGSGKDMAGLLFEPDYPFWDPIVLDFEELAQNPGWHYVDPGIHAIAIQVVSSDRDTAVIRIADERGEQLIADAGGEIVRRFPGWELSASLLTLSRGADGQWRYADIGDSGPIAESELAQMVPIEWEGRAS